MKKKKIITHYKNLSSALKTSLKEAYSAGFFGKVIPVDHQVGQRFFCVLLETNEAEYLVKLDEWQYAKPKTPNGIQLSTIKNSPKYEEAA